MPSRIPNRCYYRAPGYQPRPFKPQDLARLIRYLVRDGYSEEDIRSVLNTSGYLVIDNRARLLLDRLPDTAKLTDELEKFSDDLQSMFGDTSWNIPGWVAKLIGQIPIYGRRVKALIQVARSLQTTIEKMQNAIADVALLSAALEDTKRLAREADIP